MTKEQILELNQSSAYIENLFHTLAQLESSSYASFLSELCEDDFESMKSSITNNDLEEYQRNKELTNLPLHFSMYGFLAEIRIPTRSNYSFNKDGSVRSCSVHPGIMKRHFVFDDSMDGILQKAIDLGKSYKARKEYEARELIKKKDDRG